MMTMETIAIAGWALFFVTAVGSAALLTLAMCDPKEPVGMVSLVFLMLLAVAPLVPLLIFFAGITRTNLLFKKH